MNFPIMNTLLSENGKSYVSNDGITAKTTTDDFGRTTQVRTVRSDDVLVFSTDYEYADCKIINKTTFMVICLLS